jgi:GLPGLI family protein
MIWAQSSPNVKVEYIHTIGPSEQQTTQAHDLFLSAGNSYYLIKLSQDDRPAMKQVEKADGSLHFDVVIKSSNDGVVFHDPKLGEMVSSLPLFDELFLVKESTPNFFWSMTGNSKTVAEHVCHEALGEFRGRKYAVWFTPDIPVSAGPYKFGGLPGLILEVNEQEGKYNWYCKSIGTISEDEAVIIQRPTEGKMISYPEFHSLIITSLKRRFARMEAGGNITVGEMKINTDEWLERNR